MAAFEKGQTVRRISTHEHFSNYRGMAVGDEAVVLDATAASLVLEGWGGGHDPSRFELVPATGGPFEPRDSVRFVGPGGSAYGQLGMIAGRVLTVREGTTNPQGVIGFEGMKGMWPASKFELVAKAKPLPPEPEPEWKPGMFGTAVGGNGRARGFFDDSGDFHYPDARGVAYTASSVTDVRPLVVIDPAKVDVEAVADAYLRGVEGAPGARGGPSLRTKDGIRAALAELGIEAQ